ncbi:hypothetical protein [Pseudosulfitobacter koreensis]|uniref:Pol beta superfamily nucleotidyltransferase in conflict systems domain-containing protein n=1 Tax=Pseudosulfitobacter koreensis TaxID=2968472 RepID=A0ABT1Z1E5_9RHOB|nr:hypothetical protein [Pseudosulfitobacter koreense]MCR8826967.1 hypothetical protein [Pseudosulfitobacter koreense]
MRKEITKIISGWFADHDLETFFDRVYLFGSLVNNDGEFFWPSGVKNSDIDVLVRINPTLAGAVDRTLALVELQSRLPEVEQRLAEKLGRPPEIKGSVISVLPVTWYEIYHCIHKGFDPKIFTLNIFYDVINKRARKDGLSDFIDKSYQYDNTETFAVMRLCQKLRNDLLKTSEDGSPALNPFAGAGAIPKELMRAAALLKFAVNGADQPEARTNLGEGEDYVVDYLKDLKGKHKLIDALEMKVKKRRSTAAFKKPPLEPADLILLSELLFDRARGLSLPSVRETIDRSRRAKQGKPVYL